MDPHLLNEAERLFNELIELPGEQARARARERCASSPALLELVLSLLESDEHAGEFLRTPVITPSAPDAAIPITS